MIFNGQRYDSEYVTTNANVMGDYNPDPNDSNDANLYVIEAKYGAYILYSTCSICPLENELIIDKLSRKRNGLFEEVNLLASYPELSGKSESLSHGYIVLPDVQDGAGPLYFCLIRKTAASEGESL